tara:strand:+ start:25387 stop:26802 length:1416 start_codon:yes stop_codon:yes gene_type:complete
MHKNKEKILGLVITDGVGYRNFILSDFSARAVLHFKKIIIYSGLPATEFPFKDNKDIEVIELPIYVEPFKSWFWRKFKELAHLQLHKDFFGINDNLAANKSKGGSNRARAARFLYRISEKFHSENFIKKLENVQQRYLKKHVVTKQCISFLNEVSPDLIFFTHQRPPYVMPLFVAAKKLKIKTGSFIFSWDNLSSKGRMAANFENYLVWSELMKEELLYFYPSTIKEKIKVAGTPQFEPYVIPGYKTERKRFYSRFNLDPDLKTICYSCGDISTSRNDELYIETIARAIQKKEITEQVNLIVRTSPAEDPNRFFFLKKEFPLIRWNFPDWSVSRENHPEPWSQRVPSKLDIIDLRAILENADLSINMCSTMSLDFMIFDKPVINPVFGNEKNGLYDDQRFLKFGHYEKVVESGAVKIAKDKKSLIEAINFYLENPAVHQVERKELISMQIGKPLEGTSERISLLLKEIAES